MTNEGIHPKVLEGIEKYGLDGLVARCTYEGERCTTWYRIRERGFSEHIVAHMYNHLMKHYPEKSLRILFMKVFMGGFVLSIDEQPLSTRGKP